jgi:hypothetical protein
MDEIISYKMCAVKVRNAKLRNYLKPVFHSRISPPLAKNFATEKVHLLFFRAVNKRSNIS